MKKVIYLAMSIALILSACSDNQTTAADEATVKSVTTESASVIGEILDTEIFDEEVATLDNQVINLDEANDELVNITNAGNYVLTGSFNGQIRVNVNDEANVKLTLSGVNIENYGSACIYFVNGGKLIVSADDDTVSYLTSSGAFTEVDGEKVDGAIYARDDLQLSGHGKIIINSESGHGIVANDDFTAKNVTADITAGKKGIKVNDNAEFKSGTFTISSGSEGIEGLNLSFEEAVIDIDAGDDGINASDGSGRSMDPNVTQEGAVINISGGEITIAAGGDGIDSNGDLYISGGVLTVTRFNSGPDSAIDYSGVCEITGGTQNVPEDAGIDNMHGQNFGGFMNGGPGGKHADNMGNRPGNMGNPPGNMNNNPQMPSDYMDRA